MTDKSSCYCIIVESRKGINNDRWINKKLKKVIECTKN